MRILDIWMNTEGLEMLNLCCRPSGLNYIRIVAALHLHQVEGQHADLLHLHHHSLLGVFVEGVISSPAPYKTKTAFVDLREARLVCSIRVSRMELM